MDFPENMVDMAPGETSEFVTVIEYKASKHETWEFANGISQENPKTIGQALDADGDGAVDRWVLITPDNSEFSAGIQGKGNKYTRLDSRFSIPITITLDLIASLP